jgi:hypothetical protein
MLKHTSAPFMALHKIDRVLKDQELLRIRHGHLSPACGQMTHAEAEESDFLVSIALFVIHDSPHLAQSLDRVKGQNARQILLSGL